MTALLTFLMLAYLALALAHLQLRLEFNEHCRTTHDGLRHRMTDVEDWSQAVDRIMIGADADEEEAPCLM